MAKRQLTIRKFRTERKTIFFLFAFCALLLIFLYNIFLLKRISPGVRFAGTLISYSSQGDARAFIENRILRFVKRPLVLKLGDDTKEVSFEDAGIYISADLSFSKVYSVGRDNYLGKVPVLNKHDVQPVYIVDASKFNAMLDELFTNSEHPPVDAKIGYSKAGFEIYSEHRGSTIDRLKIISDIKNNLTTLNNRQVDVSVLEREPTVSKSDLENSLVRVKELASKKVILKYSYDSWSLSGQKLAELITFEKRNNTRLSSTFLGNIYEFSSIDALEQVTDLSIDSDRIQALVDEIAKSVDRQKIDANLRFENGKVLEFNSASDGQSLDKIKLSYLLSTVLLADSYSASPIVIELPVKIEKAKIDNAEVNSLGIRELIGTGVSYFSGSIPNRIHNLSLGTQLITGTLIKPGDVFSFTSLVGPVNAQQGFKQAYVISSGRTVLDDGGGICQVSTTVFRAALNSGLPILKRTAHAYRVAYYEQNGFKPGMDATIWSPSVDLQFKNDTGHYVLLQATVDRSKSKLEVDLYGTRDGRRVEIGDPVVSNFSPAPPPMYQDDPTLARGITKQIDFAASGATAVFTRKVFRGNDLLIDESFKSNYKPWQAVFLVGTGG